MTAKILEPPSDAQALIRTALSAFFWRKTKRYLWRTLSQPQESSGRG